MSMVASIVCLVDSKDCLMYSKISSLRDAKGNANNTGWLTVQFCFDRKVLTFYQDPWSPLCTIVAMILCFLHTHLDSSQAPVLRF